MWNNTPCYEEWSRVLLPFHSTSINVLERLRQATLPGQKIQIRFEAFMANKHSENFSGKKPYQNQVKTNTSETRPSLTLRSSGMWCHWTNGSSCLEDCSVFVVGGKQLKKSNEKKLSGHEGEGPLFLWNVTNHSPNNTAQCLRRLQSAATPLWEPQIPCWFDHHQDTTQ